MEYAPRKLKSPQLKLIAFLVHNPKASKIMAILCDKKDAYLNEIQKSVGGSKTTTVEILKKLEELKIVKSDWKITEFKGKSVPKTRAVKAFRLSEDKEKLIEYYEPILRRIA